MIEDYIILWLERLFKFSYVFLILYMSINALFGLFYDQIIAYGQEFLSFQTTASNYTTLFTTHL